jgi:glycosyltransferase involved in cell wall biosynthesis
MRLAFVVQRYGLDIAGGAEYHCRLAAEHLSRRAAVSVLTTCAADYVTWANHYPEGEESLGGIPVRRFAVERARDAGRFSALTARVLGEVARVEPGRFDPDAVARATPDDARAWLEEQGPFCPRLVEHLKRERARYDFVIFFSYRYWTTVHGLHAVPGRAVLVPTAEDDGVYHLPIFPPLFRAPRAIVYNSVEEREMIERASGNREVPGEVVGVGSELPSRVDPEAFRTRHRLEGPFLLYVGRVDLNKGCPQLFDHFRRYRRETGSPLRLVLIGRSLLPIPEDEGIVALGFRPDQEKWDALSACTAFVLPSALESLSMATLEAWWAEKPVLANAKCAVLRGQCKRANAGLYYATYDEFREALRRIEDDALLRRRLGENGRRYFEAHYSWPVVEGKYLALLDRLRPEEETKAVAQAGRRPA